MANWNHLNDELKFGVMNSMSSSIANVERIERDFLPELKADPELALASDYSGEHKKANHHVMTFLLADRPGILGGWEQERLAIRKRFLSDGRRIEFKSLGDINKQKALGPFLASAGLINGVLFCVAVEKNIESLFYAALPTAVEIAEWSAQVWPPKVFEKLLRVLNFGTFLVSGLCEGRQNLKWITDEDEIVANAERQDDTCRIAERLFNHFNLKDMRVTFGIAGKFDDGRRAEDLNAIVDLVGGAISERFSPLTAGDFPRSPGIIIPLIKPISTKSQLILAWLCGAKRRLKKMIWVIGRSPSGTVKFSFLNPQNLTGQLGKQSPLWTPPDKKWKNSSESW